MSSNHGYARSPLHGQFNTNTRQRKMQLDGDSLQTQASSTNNMSAKPKKSIFHQNQTPSSNVAIAEDLNHSTVFRHLIPEIVLGYAFWSLFHGLAPMIWFYPLNELEISGYEAFAVCFMSPILLAIPGVRDIVFKNRYAQAVLRCGVICGICSFQAPSTLIRLIMLAVGTGSGMLTYAANIYAYNTLKRSVCMWSLILSYLLMVSSRVLYTSLVPTWSDATSNTCIVTLVVIAAVDRFYTGYDEQFGISAADTSVTKSRLSSVVVGSGLASFHYLLHALYGEVSILSRWTVKGYPNTGPQPYPYGYLVFLSVCAGMLVGCKPGLVQSVTWWMIGGTSLTALYLMSRWSAYICGLVFALYLTSLTISLHDQITYHSPSITLTTATLLYIIEVLFSVWCTAYNFVPGGVYTREHTDWLLIFTMFTISATLFIISKSGNKMRIHKSFDNPAFARVYIGLCMIVCITLATSGYIYRLDHPRFSRQQKVSPDSDTDLTAGIWTYHFGYDNKGWPSLERSAQLINDTGVDVITLLESDASKPYLGNNDLASWLGERLNMYVDFGPSTRDHTWGNLLLSKYPIVKSTHHLLPSPHGELAPAISAVLDVAGKYLTIVTTHMGNDRDSLDRKLQAEYLSHIARKSMYPVIFLGYVTSAPGSRDYIRLTEHGNLKDIDSGDRSRWCEYILYRDVTRLGYARISHGGLSDTEVQVARFRVHPAGHAGTHREDHSLVETRADRVPEGQRFTDRFGEYWDGDVYGNTHRYHMSTPKYFLPRTKPAASTGASKPQSQGEQAKP